MKRWYGVMGVPCAMMLVAGLFGRALLDRPRMLLGAVDLPSGQASVAIDARTGRAFVATADDGAVRAIDLNRGVLLRTLSVQPAQPVFGYARTLLEVDERRGWAVAATSTGALFVLDGRTGAVVRAFAAAQSSGITGLALDAATGQVLLGDAQAGVVTVVDPSTGTVQRRMEVGSAYRLSLYAWRDRVLVQRGGMGGSAMLLLDTRTGRLLANMPLSSALGLFGSYFGGPNVAIDDRAGRAYVADAGAGLIRTIDLRGGRASGTISLGTRPRSIVVDPRTHHLFVLDPSADRVLLYDGASGAFLRSVAAGTGASSLAVDQRDDTVLVTSWGIPRARVFGASAPPILPGGQVRVLDARTGATLRTIPVGAAPVSVAVDAADGHAVVISNGGAAMAAPFGWLPSALRGHLPWIPAPAQSPATMPPRAEVLAAAS